MATIAQCRRLYIIASNHGWTHAGVHDLMHFQYKIASAKELDAKQYEEMIAFIESSKAPNVVTKEKDDATEALPF